MAGYDTHGPQALTGPEFGSFAPDAVTWLVTPASAADVVDVGSNLATPSLRYHAGGIPVEHPPTAQQTELFEQTLTMGARPLARAVGLLAERLWTLHGPELVLLSILRAGVPAGVMVREWIRRTHNVEVPNYAVSVVPGGDVDFEALKYVLVRHGGAGVAFLDGWTGRGQIRLQLTDSLARFRATSGAQLNDEFAVLVDPAHCADVYGTREDFAVPGACTTSVASGLVSRSFLPDHEQPGRFHIARYFRHLLPYDRSRAYVSAVSSEFDSVRSAVADELSRSGLARSVVSWDMRKHALEFARSVGVTDPALVRPGIGETLRMLLRSSDPAAVYVNDPETPALASVKTLAMTRGLALTRQDGLRYSCIGVDAD